MDLILEKKDKEIIIEKIKKYKEILKQEDKNYFYDITKSLEIEINKKSENNFDLFSIRLKETKRNNDSHYYLKGMFCVLFFKTLDEAIDYFLDNQKIK